MQALRTPDERFANLEGWPFEPRYVDVGDGLRMHYVDEGPRDAPPVLLTHGEPTWGYLYRKMIPPLVAAGRRVVVPDFIGFGRSDKPTERADYTYARHVDWTHAFLDALDLSDITLFAQDWGGLIYLVHVAHAHDRFAGVVAANTALPDPRILEQLPPEMLAQVLAPFMAWFEWSQSKTPFLASEVVGGDCPLNQAGHRLTAGEAAAYDAPFLDEAHCAGARQFPCLVPIDDRDPPRSLLQAAWQGLERYERPFVTAYGDREDITILFEQRFQQQIPGANGRKHVTVPGAGHFLQEHAPGMLVDVILGL